jgi:hypothetical protein
MRKQTVLDIVTRLPEEFHLEELLNELVFIEKVEKGIAQVNNGQIISHKTVIKNFKKNKPQYVARTKQ